MYYKHIENNSNKITGRYIKMRKYYHGDIWKLGENELFASREALEEYLKDNWEEYAYPIGDEKRLLEVKENRFGGLDIIFEVMDYDVATGEPGLWVREISSHETSIAQLTHLV